MIEQDLNLHDPHEIFSLAVDLTESDKRLGWRSLLRRVRKTVYSGLASWRQDYEADGLPRDQAALDEAVDEAVRAVAPLMTLGLIGVASERDWFVDQRSVFDAIVDVPGWDWNGKEPVFSMPWTLGYVFQSLHGAINVKTRQVIQAVDLVEAPVLRRRSHTYEPVWSCSPLIGWSAAFGNECTRTAKYLLSGVARWNWLKEIFDSEAECRQHIVAYYLLLNVHELAVHLYSNEDFIEALAELAESRRAIRLAIPLDTIQQQGPEVREQAFLALLRCEKNLPYVWQRIGVSREQMEDAWPYWMRTVAAWFAQIYGFGLRGEVPHTALFEMLNRR